MAVPLSACCALLAFVPVAVQDPAGAPPPQSSPQSSPPEKSDGPPVELLDNEALGARLAALAAAHPECASILRIGFSRERRPIDVLRLSAGEPPPGRPAILVVANLDGPQTFSSAVALHHAEALALGQATDPRAKQFLESTTLYVVARANPDAAAARWAKPLFEAEATGTGVDDDRDRRDGEDPPADVDGDGVIAWMRWKDPKGEWTLDPADPRVLVKADPKKGQRGEYRLAREGRDLDRDETPSEDAPKDAILNRNFPHDWVEHGAESGRFPMDEPEARALAEFLLLKKDIALVITYGGLDNLVEKPKSAADNAPSNRRIPAAGWLESDANLLAELAKRYGERTGNKTKGRGTEAGSFQAWVYQHRGLWSLAIALWDMPTEAKKAEAEGKAQEPPGDKEPEKSAEDRTGTEEQKPLEARGGRGAPGSRPGRGEGDPKKEDKPSEDLGRLQWIDGAGESARFLPWKSFQHPELGLVEIGGFAPFARTEPPRADWDRIAGKELDFLLSLGADLPRVSIEKLEARRLAGGLIEVEAAVLNDSLLPVSNKAGQRADASRPLKARLVLPDGAKLVGGQVQTLIRDLAGKSRRELRWLVFCDQPLQIGLKLDSDNAGEATAIVEVKQ